ncbi:putative Ig domain-containing protein [Candidatus Kaiserbacteria bacterium]|nr:putative Ig domain-containing protein [Candidatus Kaiserbacteria bacterium]
MTVILNTANGGNAVTTITAGSAGTTYEFEPGIHRLTSTSLPIRAGDTLTAQNGVAEQTIITGAEDYSVGAGKTWTQSGSQWWVSYTRTVDTTTASEFLDASFGARAQYIVDVMIDNQVLNHADDIASVTADDFYYDPGTQRIYIGVDPNTGRAIEISRYDSAINSGVDDVTISNLTFRLFAMDVTDAAVRGTGDNWVISGCHFIANHGIGLKASSSTNSYANTPNNWKIYLCKINYNGQLGLSLNYAVDASVEGCEIAYNNFARYKQSWEAGALKAARTNGVQMYNNYVHDNLALGIWFDIDNIYYDIAYNIVDGNYRSGIYSEISFDGYIRNNKLRNNNFKETYASIMEGGAILVYSSTNVKVFSNEIWTSNSQTQNNGRGGGVAIKSNDRGSSSSITDSDGNAIWRIRDVEVKWNTTYVYNIYTCTGGLCYAATDCTTAMTNTEADFDYNHYYISNLGSGTTGITTATNPYTFRWYTGGGGSGNGTINWSTWQGTYSQDANGTLSAIDPATFPDFPTWTPDIERVVHRVNAGSASDVAAAIDWLSDNSYVSPSTFAQTVTGLTQYDPSLSRSAPTAVFAEYRYAETTWTFTGLTSGYTYRLWVFVGEHQNQNRSFSVTIDGSEVTSGTYVNATDSSTDGTPNDYFSTDFIGQYGAAAVGFDFTASGTSSTVVLNKHGAVSPGVSAMLVEETNSRPLVTQPPTQISSESTIISLQIEATNDDGDAGQTLSYSASNLPGGLSISSSTGLISGTINGSAAASSPYSTSVTVTDDGSPNKSTIVYFTWYVADATNDAPVWINVPNQASNEGQTINLLVTVSDADTCSLSASGLPTGLSFLDNGNNTGTISGTISGGASASSPFSATVTADDGVNSPVDEDFTWTVTALTVELGMFGYDGCIDCDEALDIIVGLPSIFGDTYSNEPPMQVFSLMEKVPLGANLEVLWTPNIAAPEGGGQWQSSSNIDGRIPTSLNVGNVNEVIQFYFNTPSYSDFARTWSLIQRIVELSRQFGTTYYQTTPVYMRWCPAEGREQYALIKNMNAVAIKDSRDGNYNMRCTIDIEREPAWRPLPPFSNPKLWSLYANNTTQTASNVDLLSGSNDLISGTVVNKHEYDSTDYNGAPLSQNWIDIPAASIPGDAPALVQITGISAANEGATYPMNYVVIGVSSKPDTGYDASGNLMRNAYTINAGDCDRITSGGGVTPSKQVEGTDTGVYSNGSNATQYNVIVTCTASATSTTSGIAWGNNSPIIKALDKQLMRGRYAVFIRGGSSTTAGSAGDAISASLYYQETRSSIDTRTKVGRVTFPLNDARLNFCGEIVLPRAARENIGTNGLGISITDASLSNAIFELTDFTNSLGSTQSVTITDIIFIPIDEGAIYVNIPVDGGELAGVSSIVIDGTGYLSRNNNKTVSRLTATADSQVQGLVPSTIGQILLNPNTDYRMYFAWIAPGAGSSGLVAPARASMDIYINIIPRWYGVRDI